jgi:hypothetical protein
MRVVEGAEMTVADWIEIAIAVIIAIVAIRFFMKRS